MPSTHHKLISAILSGSLLVTGCGAGDDQTADSHSSTDNAITSVAIDGSVTKGPVDNAQVTIYQMQENGARGPKVAGPFTTDDQGYWQGSLPANAQGPFLTVATGGSYIDEATNETVKLEAEDELVGVIENLHGPKVIAAITPYTHAIALAAQHQARQSRNAGQSVQQLVRATTQQLGFNPTATLPPNPLNLPARVTPAQRQYASMLGGFASLGQEPLFRNTLPGVNRFQLMQALSQDISDGRLDGKQLSGAPIRLRHQQHRLALPALGGGLQKLNSHVNHFIGQHPQAYQHVTSPRQLPNLFNPPADQGNTQPTDNGTPSGENIDYIEPSAEHIDTHKLQITFDLHPDPYPSLAPKQTVYQNDLNGAKWLVDYADQYGAKISYLSPGEWMELCNQDAENCDPVLKNLYRSGKMLGTHSHTEYRAGPGNWISYQQTGADGELVWSTTKAPIDQAIRRLFGESFDTSLVNNTAGTHYSPDGRTSGIQGLLKKYQFAGYEGGPDQELAKYFGHIPFNPYRPYACDLCENLNPQQAHAVLVPQSQVIGSVGPHKNIFQDGSAPRKKIEILLAIINQQHSRLSGATPKIWSYGWGLHAHEAADKQGANRAAIQQLLPWIKQYLVDQGLAQFAAIPDVRTAYLQWEQQHPATSSFTYPAQRTDYQQYPYLADANKLLRYARHTDTQNVQGHSVHQFEAQFTELTTGRTSGGTYPGAIIIPNNDQAATLDLSALFGDTRLALYRFGQQPDHLIVAANAVPVSQAPMILCQPDDCEAMIALNP